MTASSRPIVHITCPVITRTQVATLREQMGELEQKVSNTLPVGNNTHAHTWKTMFRFPQPQPCTAGDPRSRCTHSTEKLKLSPDSSRTLNQTTTIHHNEGNGFVTHSAPSHRPRTALAPPSHPSRTRTERQFRQNQYPFVPRPLPYPPPSGQQPRMCHIVKGTVDTITKLGGKSHLQCL